MWTGFLLLGMPDAPTFSWDHLSTEALFETVRPYLLPFILGACTLSLVGAILAYPIGLFVISRYRKKALTSTDSTSCSGKPA